MVLFCIYFIICILPLCLEFAQSRELKGGNSKRVLAIAPCEGKACQQSADLSSEAATASADQGQLPVERVKLSKPVMPRLGWMQQKELKKEYGQKRSFIEYPKQPNVTNESNFNIQSFISEGMPDVGAAVDKILKFCNHEENDTTWLECDKSKYGHFALIAKTDEVVVFGRLLNNGSHNVKVYRNSSLKAEGKSLMDIDWDENNLVTVSNQSLPIVVKINVLDTVDMNERGSYNIDKYTKAIDAEVRRARSATKFTFPDGESVTRNIYDIRIGEAELAHPINEVAYIQEDLSGDDAYSIMAALEADEHTSIVNHLQMTLDEGDKWLNAVNLKRLELDEKSDTAVASGTEGPAAEHLESFKAAASRFKEELWMRARARLSLISFVYNAALLMWNDMMHCHCTWDNIMLVEEVITTPAELESAKRDGSTIILNPKIYLSNPTVSPEELAELKRGVVVYRLTLDRVKFISLAFALPHEEIEKDIEKWSHVFLTIFGVREDPLFAEQYLSPCKVLRPRPDVAEDFYELYRRGAHQALESRNFGVWNDHILAKSELGIGDPRAMKYDGRYKHISNLYNSVMQPAVKDLNELRMTFEGAKRELMRLKQLEDCKYESVRTEQTWTNGLKVVGVKCSLQTMIYGVAAVRDILRKAADRFPSFAPVTLFYDS